MKVVFASTPEQESRIEELIQQYYTEIFPLYFNDEEIREFQRAEVLHTTSYHFESFGTLKEACKVIVSLETIASILLMRDLDERYEGIFFKNVHTLQEYGLFFPFEFKHFYNGRLLKQDMFSVYTKPANELLI